MFSDLRGDWWSIGGCRQGWQCGVGYFNRLEKIIIYWYFVQFRIILLYSITPNLNPKTIACVLVYSKVMPQIFPNHMNPITVGLVIFHPKWSHHFWMKDHQPHISYHFLQYVSKEVIKIQQGLQRIWYHRTCRKVVKYRKCDKIPKTRGYERCMQDCDCTPSQSLVKFSGHTQILGQQTKQLLYKLPKWVKRWVSQTWWSRLLCNEPWKIQESNMDISVTQDDNNPDLHRAGQK